MCFAQFTVDVMSEDTTYKTQCWWLILDSNKKQATRFLPDSDKNKDFPFSREGQ